LPMLRRACRWKRHPPAMRSSWRISYIYISYSFRLFFSSKKVSEVREPPPPESP
jgi:hypothetical protein